MIIKENIVLAPYTTFKIGGSARFFCIAQSVEDIRQAIAFAKDNNLAFFVLGGGSNVLVSDAGFTGLVIKVEIAGREVRNSVICAGAGENWDDFVAWTIEQGFNGLENLSAIPGTVGAAPVQNIGAYGVEVGQCIESVRVFDTTTLIETTMSARDCHFGYRNSVFKHEKGRYIIISVDFHLKKDGKVNVEYKDLKQYFQNNQFSITNDQIITPLAVRDAVTNIRKNKLPDWKVWGTAGSFFKNPSISQEKFEELQKTYPTMPGFPESDGKVKIPLGWILDNVCHAKGVMHGAVGTYEKQALVVIAKAGATAEEVVSFTRELMKEVEEKTGILIEAEVEWVN